MNSKRLKGIGTLVLELLHHRDKGICGICFEPVDLTLRGRALPMSPSTDHIVPLSHGGKNETSNVRLAHAICNERKGCLNENAALARHVAEQVINNIRENE